MTRIVTAVALLSVLCATIAWAPPWAFYALLLGAGGRATWECYRLLELRGSRPFKLLGLAAGAGIATSFFLAEPGVEPELFVIAAMMGTTIAAMWWRPDPPAMLDASVTTLFPILFVALPLAYMVAIRRFPGEPGRELLFLLLLCVGAGDTLALYVGTWLGRHRLAPRLSPRKSWEGAAAAVLARTAGAVVARQWFYESIALPHAVTLGALLGATGILSDLAESMVKRAVGAKDSSALLPGHGGLLDRTDSLLFTAPVLYYYYRLFLDGS